MKRTSVCFLYVIIIMIMAAPRAKAQSDKSSFDSVSLQVKNLFNQGKALEIYAITNATFRQKMSASQFVLGMEKFIAKNGNWKTLVFRTTGSDGAHYDATFENGKQVFSIQLDQNGKISRLNFAAVAMRLADKRDVVPSTNKKQDKLDQFVEQLARPYVQKGNTAGLVLAIIENGKVRRYSYGTVNKKVKQLPSPAHTIFEIGSLTKTFTALLLAKDVDEKQVNLDDPINNYLPDSIPVLAFSGQQITVKHLANHTAGFPRLPENIFSGKVDPQNPYQHYQVDSLYAYLKRYRPSVVPGSRFAYSNLGAGVLGTVLERRTGKKLEELFRAEIFTPLQMNQSAITLNNSQQQHLAQGYNEQGEATSLWDLASLQGSGAIRSTLDDMVKYAKAQLEADCPLKGPILLTHQKTFDGKDEDMALGWRISKGAKQSYFHHSGGTGGFRSFIGFSPTRNFAVVILSNAAADVTDIGKSILER